MKLLFLLLFILKLDNTFCQPEKYVLKKNIDSTAIKNWNRLGSNRAISNNGMYFLYNIMNQPRGSSSLVVQSTNTKWRKEYLGADNGFFSSDSKSAMFQHMDTLFFLSLGENKCSYVLNVSSFKVPESGNVEWVAYLLNGPKTELVLHNLTTNQEHHFDSIIDYSFDIGGNTLLMESKSSQTNRNTLALNLVKLPECQHLTIWSSSISSQDTSIISQYIFDSDGGQLAFIVQNKTPLKTSHMICYYRIGTEKVEVLADDRSIEARMPLSIVHYGMQFSKNGRWLFFLLQQIENRKPNEGSVKVDIWNYKDPVLQPLQIKQSESRQFITVLNVDTKQLLRVERENERVITTLDWVTGDFVVVLQNYFFENSGFEHWWTLSSQPSVYLLYLNDGSRKLLKEGENTLTDFSFSPYDKYLVYYDSKERNYFSYNIKTATISNITHAIPARMDNEYENNVFGHSIPVGLAGWIKDDTSIMIYDNYDIWKVDPKGKHSPINITNGYGQSHHIKLRLVDGAEYFQPSVVFDKKETLLLTGFNSLTKYNGFYQTKLDKRADPELLTMGPYTFFHAQSQIPKPFDELSNAVKPMKARAVNSWVVQRESVTEAPNYFLTSNFKTYYPLTDLQPQEKFNWVRSELVNWKQLDGSISQGILYKPEDFNPSKKYPIIFHYYEKFSFRLYEYPLPEFTGSGINIPWFVSHGYLVFTPDIHYSIASMTNRVVGESVSNAVLSAALYFAKKPWVDAKCMGIQGHSFGGQETNYLVTHSNLFAAAAEAAGISDPLSAYLTLVQDKRSKQSGFELGHEAYGCTPWERPDLYRKNSAVLNADKAATPLLIMHNKNDNQIQWQQGVEFFMALRRLGKQVWMLQYDEGSHGLFGKDAEDYTIRLTQFFDHFLKSCLPPRWMTNGVPASLKGIETGLETDAEGKCGEKCPVCRYLIRKNSITKYSR